MKKLIFLIGILLLSQFVNAVRVEVDIDQELKRLLVSADADGDKRITVKDLHNKNSVHTSSNFWLQGLNGQTFEVSGIYFLSNLLQELKLAQESKLKFVDGEHIFEKPVARISRLIRDVYWNGLTRRVDAGHLKECLVDSKVPSSTLYVPSTDERAYRYFSQANKEHPELKFAVRNLAYGTIPTAPGLLVLGLQQNSKGELEGVPFVVPGGRFNEMYGWDSYFEALGLLQDGRLDLAKAMVDNLIYEIQHYGKILNANRSYYLNRSQPPFLTSMILAVYGKMEKNLKSKQWLHQALQAAVLEYTQYWINPEHLTPTGLSRYFGTAGASIPPEVEKGHFDFILKPAARRLKLSVAELVRRYNLGTLKDTRLDDFFSQDRAVRESGHDTTSRWRVNGQDRAADFVTVDLNSLLYKYEIDLARTIHREFGDLLVLSNGDRSTSKEWRKRANDRRQRMLRYLWDPAAKMFFDYNFKSEKRATFVSATAFYPLWAWDPADPSSKILDDRSASESIAALLAQLEAPGGVLSASLHSSREFGNPAHPRQWDYPNGWAPHQILIWKALKNYGDLDIMNRLIYKWLFMITQNAVDYNGTIPEKFDVVKRSHAVFAEYGNVGTQFSYITKEGFGWMNASYQLGLEELSPRLKAQLDRLKPPEWLD